MAPSNHHLFRNLKYDMRENRFETDREVKSWTASSMGSKSEDLFSKRMDSFYLFIKIRRVYELKWRLR